MAAILETRKAHKLPPVHTLDPCGAREIWNQWLIQSADPREEVGRVVDLPINRPYGRMPARVYVPKGTPPFSVLVFFHGGGWVLGNLDTHDSLCRTVCNCASCVVLSVDYRLAPDYKYPAAVEDCYAAVKWGAERIQSFSGNPVRIAVGGDSAGGNLSAAVCLKARDQSGPPIFHQLLIYPILDLYSLNKDPYRRAEDFYSLTIDEMDYYCRHYIAHKADLRQPYASPLQVRDLSNLPPATIITAEFDILTEECKAYAQRLGTSGVQVDFRSYRGMVHGFVRFGAILENARGALLQAANGLRS
jgi:acetyl esterase